jgi:hypothetical protein
MPGSGPTTVTVPLASGGTASLHVLVEPFRFGMPAGGGAWREVAYSCPWSKIYEATRALKGGIKTTQATTFGSIVRTSPHQFPSDPNLYCVSAEGYGAGVPCPDPFLVGYTDGLGAEGLGIILARYETFPFDLNGSNAALTPPGITPIPWTRWHIHGYTQQKLVNNSAGKFLAAGENPAQKVPKRFSYVEFVVDFLYVPVFFLPTFVDLINCVNVNILFGFNPGFIIFDDFDIQGPEPAFDGTLTNTVSLRFLAQKEAEWNKFPRDDDSDSYDFIVSVASGNKLYQYKDLTLAWQ